MFLTFQFSKLQPKMFLSSAVLCSALARPKDGGVVPAACGTGSREYRQRCVVYCKHGYRLTGPATKYCQADKSWSTNSPNECVKSRPLLVLFSLSHNDTKLILMNNVPSSPYKMLICVNFIV